MQSPIDAQSHSLRHLPATSRVLPVVRLQVADHGPLPIPSGLTDMQVAELRLGRGGRIAIAADPQALPLEVAHAEIALGARR